MKKILFNFILFSFMGAMAMFGDHNKSKNLEFEFKESYAVDAHDPLLIFDFLMFQYTQNISLQDKLIESIEDVRNRALTLNSENAGNVLKFQDCGEMSKTFYALEASFENPIFRAGMRLNHGSANLLRASESDLITQSDILTAAHMIYDLSQIYKANNCGFKAIDNKILQLIDYDNNNVEEIEDFGTTFKESEPTEKSTDEVDLPSKTKKYKDFILSR